MAEVRKARAADVPAIARTLARGFQDDPAFTWAAPEARLRERHGPRYFALLLERIYLPKDEVHMVDDGSAVAIWAPPDRWQAPMSASLPMLPTLLRTSRGKLPRAMKMLSAMEGRHRQIEEPHWYLPFIATDPDHQGKGHGAALLTSMLERCDLEGLPAYLESTAERNQALYHRHGFRPLEEQRWPGGGPPWWPMWRPPRG